MNCIIKILYYITYMQSEMSVVDRNKNSNNMVGVDIEEQY